MTHAELVALLKPAIHDALGSNGWAYSNYGGNELVDCADRLEAAALAALATIAEALRVPIDAMTEAGKKVWAASIPNQEATDARMGALYWNANACWRAMLAASPLVQGDAP